MLRLLREGFPDRAIQIYLDILSATDNPDLQINVYRSLGSLYAQLTQTATAEEMYDQIYQIAENRIEDPTQSLALKLQALGGKAEILHASDYFDRVREVHKHALTLIENATGIVGLTRKRKVIINWAHTGIRRGLYSAATIYDQVIVILYFEEMNQTLWQIV